MAACQIQSKSVFSLCEGQKAADAILFLPGRGWKCLQVHPLLHGIQWVHFLWTVGECSCRWLSSTPAEPTYCRNTAVSNFFKGLLSLKVFTLLNLKKKKPLGRFINNTFHISLSQTTVGVNVLCCLDDVSLQTDAIFWSAFVAWTPRAWARSLKGDLAVDILQIKYWWDVKGC